MAIEKLRNGRYKVRVDYAGRDAGSRRRRVVTVDTYDEALELERSYRRRPADGHRRTVLDAVNHFLLVVGRDLESATFNTYTSTRDTYLAPTWLGAVELDKLERSQLQRFYGEIQDGRHSPVSKPGPKSRRTAQKVHRLVSVAIENVLDEWTTRNPCRDVKRFRGKRSRVRPAVVDDYELGDVSRVLDAAARPRRAGKGPNAKAFDHARSLRELVDLVHFAVVTGARAGELAALRWRDVELRTGTVRITGSITRKIKGAPGPVWIRKGTKNGDPRTLVVGAAVVTMLEDRYRRQSELALVAGVDPDTLDDRAIWSLELELGHTSPAAIGQRWRRAADAAGVELKFHDLRHVSASELSAAGVPTQTATARTGHGARLFHETYGHRRKGSDPIAAAALDESWSQIESARGTRSVSD
jgi:integrase